MNKLQVTRLEAALDSLFWQLYIPVRETGKNHSEVWHTFIRDYPQHAEQIQRELVIATDKILSKALNSQLGIATSTGDRSNLTTLIQKLWKEDFLPQLNSREIANLQREIRIIVEKAIAPQTLLDRSDERSVLERLLPSCEENGKTQRSLSSPVIEVEQSTAKNRTREGTWQYHPLPTGEPDRHAEFYAKAGISPSEYQLLGARVRGKKHKHDGSNCDDWFEFSTSGDWTIIAVSDGAGSKVFSRVGAKVSCQAAVRYLESALADCKLKKRENWSANTFARDGTTGAFAEEDLETLQKALHEAMEVAYTAVEEAVAERLPYTAYYKSLNHREIEVRDLSATLLLAVQTVTKYKGVDYSLILTCQIGDGAIAAIDGNDETQLLSLPDRGEFAGETEFLTSPGTRERDYLMRKTFPFFRPLKALLVMTDGVADDYFPYPSRMLELYGDLLANQIVPFPQPNLGEVCDRISETSLGTLQAVEEAKAQFQSVVRRLTSPEDEVRDVRICSIAKYAQALGCEIREIVRDRSLLAATFLGEEQKSCPPEVQLQNWLDTYTIKGSFDDRTLVILNARDRCRELNSL